MHAIQRGGHSAFRSIRAAYVNANGSKRALSRSCACSRGALPVFLEPSSPELSTLLATLNTKVLLPANLNKEQKNLVYKQEHKAKLEAEPVEITLGDVTLPLEHLDRNQLPDRWKLIREILDSSKTTNDWKNVVRILEGTEEAGILTRRRAQIVRQLNLSENQHLVLQCLQRPKASGLRLSDHGLLKQVLRGIHDKASMADWAEDETTQAYRMAKNVVELMDDKEHCGGQTRGDAANKKDWRGSPSVVALPTEMAARLADGHGGNTQEVKTLANRLVTALKQSDFKKELDDVAQRSAQNSTNLSTRKLQIRATLGLCDNILQLIIVLNALRTSRKVLGTDMPQADEALAFEQRVDKVVSEGTAAVERLSTRKGMEFESPLIAHVKTSVEKCR